ncbi:MAG TPA: trypsin-like peptidase domain-containing protein, partial [Deinococcales bacterium]|nr:trypsin-like peptidase domain-containing protein [Deinococcales bacterium]
MSKRVGVLLVFSALVAPVAAAQTTMDQLCAVNAHSNRVNVTADARAVADKVRAATVRVDTADGYGTGFILSPDNVVVTAYHVVRDAKAWTVTTSTRHEYKADLVGFDELRDLAVLKVDWGKGTPSGLSVESGTPKAGDAVVAIGNSCDGFDAARYGQITSLQKDLGKSFPGQMIQSNLPLAPGDSGGPVVNLNGRVVGVSDAIEADQGGLSSYIAPLYNAHDALASVKGGEQREVPFIGVGLQDLDSDAVSRIGAGV